MANTTDRLVWVDCEMTGLNLATDALIEIAVLVTDGDLTLLGDGVQVVIRPPDAALGAMAAVVRDMHAASGLSAELAAGVSLDQAQALVMAYVLEHVPESRRAPLAGNTVHMDRLFLARDLPELEQHLHYRNVDVSSLKELVRRWYPRVYYAATVKTGNHRALGDIRDSIAELEYYRRTVFVPLPGPDSDQARAAASSLADGVESVAGEPVGLGRPG